MEIQLIFEKSLATGKLHSNWTKANVSLSSRPTTKYSVTGKVVCRRYRCLPNSLLSSRRKYPPSRPGLFAGVGADLGYGVELFNPGKCQVLHISNSNYPFLSQYTLHGQVLESTDSAKYLGINISKTLNWNYHISEITNKANRNLGFVKRNMKTRNEAVTELAYKTLVRPQVEYASLFFCVYFPPTAGSTHVMW